LNEERESVSEAVYPFEDTGDNLSLLPLAARRALDVSGFRLSLEGYQSLALEDRLELALSGTAENVDTQLVEALVRLSAVPATRIKPAPDPDRERVPEQLASGQRRGRPVSDDEWRRLRAVDRYALLHTMRRSIAREDPERLELAIATILGPEFRERPSSLPPSVPAPSRSPAATTGSDLPPALSTAPSRRAAAERSSRPARRSALPEMPAVRDAPPRRDAPAAQLPRLLDIPESRPRSSAPPPPHDATLRTSLSSEYAYDRVERGLGKPRGDELSDPPSAPLSSHLSARDEVHMVDVGAKPITERRASASGTVRMSLETVQRLARNDVPKGEVLATARIAGIMAAKRTPELVPLCHSVALTRVDVLIDIERAAGEVHVTAIAEAADRTGVEMEALTAVSVACLTIYDMLKGIDRSMVISDVKLLSKRGGRTGPYERRD
jgi:cyclic pyranopterin monophosphate synthase